ncbi:hypothetical protein A28LD_1914 [Idiomarina sp. A28L]|uniref:pilus assembly PilX family protein n=1 Tax=Idiomarina sp. A28L TaxID=1036674 RepID=UPI00021388BF|nr:pilus assembly PilX N-terminal domain-containing protein [Idiomarina sp. A28L]EGN74897.1 hypothetical protein A28LD_1914 [Idiomarina sp. A28L]
MFHNFQGKIPSNTPRYQRGSALAVAIFIIVVMSIIGVAMVRILSDLGRATVSDVYGARAYASARTGAELFLTELFPLDASTNISACPERIINTPPAEQFTENFEVAGLFGCEARVACDRLELSAPFNGTHFRIITQGICDTGETTYSKQVILEAFDGGN